MATPLKLLTLATLADLGDGSLTADFAAVLAALVKDCTARPSIKKTRRLTLTIDVVPVLKTDGTCDDVTVDVEVGSKSPAKAIPTYTCRATVNGGIKFNADSPDNPDQKTMDF